MTKAQTHALRLSEVRQRLNEITGLEGDAFTDEIRQESDKLTVEYRDTETRYRAALVSEGDDAHLAGSQFGAGGSAEDRAYRELVSKSNVGAIFTAAVEKRATSGADAELQQHHGLHSNQIALDLLRGPVVEEHRAITASPANVGASQEPIIQPVFATGDAAFLGIDMPSVPTGDAVFPVLTTRPTVRGPFTDDSDAAETDGTFAADLLKPGRIQASFSYLRTDAARFGGMGESLRMALAEGLSEGVDQKIINGASGSAERREPRRRTRRARPSPRSRSSCLGSASRAWMGATRRVDPICAYCSGARSYAVAGGTYRGADSEESALDRLMAIVADVKVSAHHVPAVAATKKAERLDQARPAA